jgi:hypothetical protein
MEEVDIKPLEQKKQEPQEEQKPFNPQQEEQKNEGRKILITIAVLVGILLLFLGGSRLYNSYNPVPTTIDEIHEANLAGDLPEEQGYIYNGFSFINIDGLWWTQVMRNGGLVKFPLHFGPRDVDTIEVFGSLNPAFFQSEEIFIAINPLVVDKHYTLAISELSLNLVEGVNKIPIGACTEEDPACIDRTIINCKTSNGRPVIELALDEKTKIELDDTCIKLSGQGFEIVKVVDRLLFHWYNVIVER